MILGIVRNKPNRQWNQGLRIISFLMVNKTHLSGAYPNYHGEYYLGLQINQCEERDGNNYKTISHL